MKPSLTDGKQRWDTPGWCVIEDVIPPDLLAAATLGRGRIYGPSPGCP